MNTKFVRVIFIACALVIVGFSEVSARQVTWSPPIEMDEGRKTIPQGERISAPYSINASDGSSDEYIYVTWDSVDGATYYELYVNDDNDSSYLSSPVYSGSNTSYDDNSGYGGTYYYYWVKACDESRVCSDLSSSDSGYINLDKPTSVTASDGDYTDKIEVTWNLYSRVTGPDIEVYRNDTDDSSSATFLAIANGSPYSDSDVDPGKYYYYWVQACGDDAELCSGLSNSSDQGHMKVDPPDNVSATNGIYSDRVEIDWSFSSVSLYEVFRNTSDDHTGETSLGTENGPPFSDTTAIPGTTYYYWVKAWGPDVSSDYSTSDSGYRSLELRTGVTATDGTFTDKVQISWSDTRASIQTFQVWRNTVDTSGTAGLLADDLSSSPYDDTTAEPGTTYFYWVKQCYPGVCSDFSNSDSGYRAYQMDYHLFLPLIMR